MESTDGLHGGPLCGRRISRGTVPGELITLLRHAIGEIVSADSMLVTPLPPFSCPDSQSCGELTLRFTSRYTRFSSPPAQETHRAHHLSSRAHDLCPDAPASRRSLGGGSQRHRPEPGGCEPQGV